MKYLRLLRLPILALTLLLSFQPSLSATWQEDGDTFRDVLRSAQRDRWEQAETLASQVSQPAAATTVEWLRLRDGVDDFQDYLDFLDDHGDWPGLKILRKSGESAMTTEADPRSIVQYFVDQQPQTGNGALRLTEALFKLGLADDAAYAIQDGWKSLPFTASQHDEALREYSDILAPMHLIRLENMLWQGRHAEANRLLPLLDSGWVRVAEARIALQNRANGVDSRIRSIPPDLRNNPSLSFDRVVWRLKDGSRESALALLEQTSTSNDALEHPELWARLRLEQAKRLMRGKNYQRAYRIASSHYLTELGRLPRLMLVSAAHRERAERSQRSNFASLEWLSGYLQLRFLNNPQLAIAHFVNFESVVDTPISKGRAGYWLGRAYEAAGQNLAAAQAYKRGAVEQTTFYGQLAAEKIGFATNRNLSQPNMTAEYDADHLLGESVVQAALLYRHAGHHSQAAWFLAHVAETLNEADSFALAALAFDHGAIFAAVKVAKEGVKNGYEDIVHLFPLVGVADYDLPVPAEVPLSIARQETEFRETAVSNAGAVGFMQIKPSTGQELADNIGLVGPIDQLLRQRKNNVLLGSTYIKDRMDENNGSYMMAFAAYNAGPGRVRSWLPTIGNPVAGDISAIDWIEHIPFQETRNYVMRVMEAVTVYRMRLDGETQPISLSTDLSRGLP